MSYLAGAQVIKWPGAFSIEPEEFAMLVKEGSSTALVLGNSKWSMQNPEKESRRLRGSLYITKEVVAGDLVTYKNVRAIRPGGGCAPKFFGDFIGRKFTSNQAIGALISPELIID